MVDIHANLFHLTKRANDLPCAARLLVSSKNQPQRLSNKQLVFMTLKI